MYDEVMQLIALAKNDEAYFKRIDALKQQMLELAQVKEIAKTLGEADMHLASARQQADILLEEALKTAEEMKGEATYYIQEQKLLLEKTKLKKQVVDNKETELQKSIEETKVKQEELEKSIVEHRRLSAERNEESEKAQKVRKEFEDKLRAIKEIANK
jgi:hypothetical protein